MKKIHKMAGVACAAALATGAVVVPAAVGAAPTGSGAYIVARQGALKTHTLCVNGGDVMLYAEGFAANRTQVVATVEAVGAGFRFTVTIPLTNGHGLGDAGTPPTGSEGKYLVHYQTGSSDNSGNNGSFSATVKDC